MLDTLRQCGEPGCESRFPAARVNQRHCPTHRAHSYRAHVHEKKRTELHEVDFIGVDGEGVGNGRNHKYVLLGAGDDYRVWPDGATDIREIFEFLYAAYEKHPHAVFCGFFLGYDFNMWLKLLPRERAAMLLTDKGRAVRRRKSGYRNAPHPVEYGGWQFDMLGYKRFKLRPKRCKCKTVSCPCAKAPWMYINDTGPFFQSSFLSVIDPASWGDDPVVSPEEFAKLEAGKKRRDRAKLDQDMIDYNALENRVLARVMDRLNRGLVRADVRLKRTQWFGPGQAAQSWLKRVDGLERVMDHLRGMPTALRDSIIATYYGGWFEIPCHGRVTGRAWEYDLNSAYPWVAANLPCVCDQGKWRKGKGLPRRNDRLRLCRVRVSGSDLHLGPLPYRRSDGRVCRPRHTEGWYWQHEIDAATRAGLIDECDYLEWWEYAPCGHPPPLAMLAELYTERLRAGKDTPFGKALKLIYNSIYGKFAQSLGEPVYGNPLYASLITAGCRTRILDAIATHPRGSEAVAMVATDGVYFLWPHPSLTISTALGDWSCETKDNLTLFKPGIYWDDVTRDRLREGLPVKFKARGISAQAFSHSIDDVDRAYDEWGESGLRDVKWPVVEFKAGFTQTSIMQALQWSVNRPWLFQKYAGAVESGRTLTQNPEPSVKRNPLSLWWDSDRGVYRTEPWDHRGYPPSAPYEKRFGFDDEMTMWDGFSTPDGPALKGVRDALHIGQ